jgi:hypothetical protein
MNKEIDRVCELLAISPDESFVLLKQLKWNRRRLEEEFFDDCAALRSRCGVSEGWCAVARYWRREAYTYISLQRLIRLLLLLMA